MSDIPFPTDLLNKLNLAIRNVEREYQAANGKLETRVAALERQVAMMAAQNQRLQQHMHMIQVAATGTGPTGG